MDLGGNAGPVVQDPEDESVAVSIQGDARVSAASAVADGVVHQVAHRLLQQGQGAANTGSQLSNRLRAVLLTKRGRTRADRLRNLEAARRILLDQLNQSGTRVEDSDRLLLAGICEKEAFLQEDVHIGQRNRFCQKVVRTATHRLNGDRNVSGAGDDHNRHVWAVFPEFHDTIQAAPIGKL